MEGGHDEGLVIRVLLSLGSGGVLLQMDSCLDKNPRNFTQVGRSHRIWCLLSLLNPRLAC